MSNGIADAMRAAIDGSASDAVDESGVGMTATVRQMKVKVNLHNPH
ncbi:hypothetical protein [Burkholderia ubonensis]|nr:hypothetical protein [Burkholderia ubonensis]